jgi:3-hydroxybutyryl-CoA dehydratase
MNALPKTDNIHSYYFEDLSVGITTSYAKMITETDTVLFADISGDDNPVHLSERFATETMFEGHIAHGMRTGSFISTALGAELPGLGCIYPHQDLRFLAPVRPCDTIHPQITITDVNAEKKASTRVRSAASAIPLSSRKRQPYSCQTDARRMRPV